MYYLSKIEIKGKVEGLGKSEVKEIGQEKGALKAVSQETSEVKEDGHKKNKVKVENRISVR